MNRHWTSDTLYQVIAEQQGRGHTVCMTMS